MKHGLKVLLVSLVASLVLAGCGAEKKDDEGWRVGYSLGYKLGDRIHKEMADLDLDGFVAGFRDAFAGGGDAQQGKEGAGKAAKMTAEEMDATLKAHQEAMVARKRDEFKKHGERNLADAKAFMAENAAKEGVVTLPSGLQYQVIAKGEGPSPKATDIVKARYHGTLIDGTVFDSTRERGDNPAEFPLNRVIPAWTEGLQLMSRGAKYKLFVPPELGYGERGAGGKIGPNQALVFEVELVDFHDPAKP